MTSPTVDIIWQRLVGLSDNSTNDVVGSGAWQGTISERSVQPLPTPFTSSAFAVLPTPLPVKDVFVLPAWPLTTIRVVTRGLNLWLIMASVYDTSGMILFFPVLCLLSLRYFLPKMGVEGIAGVRIPGFKEPASGVFRWPQKTWVGILTCSLYST